jgi:hypothetical protein
MTIPFIASNGARAALDALLGEATIGAVVTGSFAAYRRAPVAAPTLLTFYTLADSAIAQRALGLLPADEGADVIVLRPPNKVPLQIPEEDEGISYAAPTQVVIDCLAGPGRMPAEGEALIEAMKDEEDRWRRPDLETYLREIGGPS